MDWYKMEFDVDLLINDKDKSLIDGAIAAPGWQSVVDKEVILGVY